MSLRDSLVHIGTVGENVERCTNILEQRCGLSLRWALWYSGFDLLDYTDNPVYLLDGLPFVLDLESIHDGGEEGVLFPYGNNTYHLYRDHYKPVFERHGAEPVPGLFYPLMPKHDSFESYVRSVRGGQYNSQMRGAKQTRVQWMVTYDKDVMDDILAYSYDMFMSQCRDVRQRYPSTDIFPIDEERHYQHWHLMPKLEGGFLVYAQDTTTGEIGGVMHNFVHKQSRTVDCFAIAINRDDKWKPYSLASCAHLAVAQEVMSWYDGHEYTVNFGMNPPGVGSYKEVFSVMEPIIGLVL